MLVQTTRDDHRIAWFAALAITIHIAESALPSPLPGVKPGLANVVTIVVLMQFGWRMAVWVNLLRVVAGSLIIGTFLTPTFILSLSGALASTASLVLLSQLPKSWQCSPIGYSVTAAMLHMVSQFWVAYWLFIQHDGLFHLLPPLLTASLFFGIVSGVIAANILARLQKM
ncbi:Gx transporter family protein [Candidatus Albibeggiatoa sp. nov. NOAA]|uniref:Gx transporter family protein n=1 Tax=Candidatus Albibeggiatoa sp. nov. NOAA TaxID=3162724 RepID=UPI0032F9B1FC|nr:Gx transporter family protein [Thiotrichaceae bacterium]